MGYNWDYLYGSNTEEIAQTIGAQPPSLTQFEKDILTAYRRATALSAPTPIQTEKKLILLPNISALLEVLKTFEHNHELMPFEWQMLMSIFERLLNHERRILLEE